MNLHMTPDGLEQSGYYGMPIEEAAWLQNEENGISEALSFKKFPA